MISIETNWEATRRTGKTRYAAVSDQPMGGCPSCKEGQHKIRLKNKIGKKIHVLSLSFDPIIKDNLRMQLISYV